MKVINRRARYDYQLFEKFEAGIVLTGAEVKSVKAGKMKLEESFVRLAQGEAWLHNAYINPYPFADNREYDPRRPRKLLLHKSELLKLAQKIKGKGLTVVPVSCYNRRRQVKLEIALAKGKRKFEKREKIKKRDYLREQERAMKK